MKYYLLSCSPKEAIKIDKLELFPALISIDKAISNALLNNDFNFIHKSINIYGFIEKYIATDELIDKKIMSLAMSLPSDLEIKSCVEVDKNTHYRKIKDGELSIELAFTIMLE